jgi:hypothetical protein
MIQQGEVFEYYRNRRGEVEKFAVRCCNMSNDYDIIYVINQYGGLVTSWINTKNEQHEDMKMEVYEQGMPSIPN